MDIKDLTKRLKKIGITDPKQISYIDKQLREEFSRGYQEGHIHGKKDGWNNLRDNLRSLLDIPENPIQ